MSIDANKFPTATVPALERAYAGHRVWGGPDLPEVPIECLDVPILARIVACADCIGAEGAAVSPRAILDRMGDELVNLGGPCFLAELIKQAHAGPSISACAAGIIDAFRRRYLVALGAALELAGAEIALDATGATCRLTGIEQAVVATDRMACFFSALQAVAGPALPLLLRGAPSASAKFVVLLPGEIELLAGRQIELALSDEAAGDRPLGVARRERAEQLLSMFGAVP